MHRPILTVTSDFGRDGPYVAAMKGVVLGLAPDAQIVDVSHSIAPQNVLEGAFVLANIVDAFPPGTVHLAVVDPGVGTERRLLAVSVAGQWFVAPDNGLLGGVVRDRDVTGIWEITNPALWRTRVSSTFHGRDILAPAAAHLLLGRDPDQLGPKRAKLIALMNFEPRSDVNGLVGEVIFRDAFGNLITNVSAARLSAAAPEAWSVEIAGETINGLIRTYGDKPPGTIVALAGSSGWVEIAVVNGDAARTLTAGPGMTVWFRRKVLSAMKMSERQLVGA
jgi:S-adenosyl-L-methionine hydrolase (adenosine-forming)